MSSATCGARRPIPTAPIATVPSPAPIAAPADRLLPRLQAALDHAVAGALRHVDPGVALPVALGGARAGRVGGLTVVLAGLRDPEALLVLELGRGRRSRLRPGDGGDRAG